MLDTQGEVALAGEVRQFVQRLPRFLTDKEALAEKFMRHLETQTEKSLCQNARTIDQKNARAGAADQHFFTPSTHQPSGFLAFG